eukprot:TRINITY_DN5224_c0_g1_i1.p1 TRINITY_DN5224_c0_g1~~TRINITY_DN5224_c0_g1_i1.p1  ORF type:complete len:125 (-),score=12.80 TRINITY_DN5224_c0_g1_i1:63-437(-)
MKNTLVYSIEHFPARFNEDFLGCPVEEYIANLFKPSAVIGDKEIEMLAVNYGSEFAVCDIDAQRLIILGKGFFGRMYFRKKNNLYSRISWVSLMRDLRRMVSIQKICSSPMILRQNLQFCNTSG